MFKKGFHSKTKVYISVIAIYILVVFIANWSLLIGENVMKWDIAEAHYPYMVFMGDAIKNGQLPLWNPMIQYGTPQYAIAGMPVWYPVSLILAVIGYSPYMMGFEYSIHMVLAGFGMFLLIKSYSKSNDEYLWAIISGVLYMFSTVFISNAQHIMIVISATWIPYVMLNIKNYIIDREIKKLFLAGGFAALIILGGYPEILAGTFLCMIPYIFIENHKTKENQKLIIIGIDSLKVFSKVCICTILGGAITLIPFMHSMLFITRGLNANVAVQPVSITALITSVLPGTSSLLPLTGDISMIYSYAGIITVITFFIMLYINKQGYKSYLCIAAFAFIMSEGTSFFLYSLFHRFVPLFSSFRFPSTWRCLVVIFLFIPCSMVWANIDKKEISDKFLKVTTIMGCCLVILGSAVLLVSYIFKGKLTGVKIEYIAASIGITSFILLMYIPIIFKIRKESLISKKTQIALLCVSIIEVLLFQFCEFPVTIGTFMHGKYDVAHMSFVNNQYKNRIKNFELKDSKETNTTKTSQNIDIISNHELDENGYMSFRLSGTETYQGSANRLIASQNPTTYFTNNVVTNEQVDLQQWLQNADVPSAQIHANKLVKIENNDIYKDIGNIQNARVSKMEFERKSDTLYKITNINATENRYTVKKLMVYIKNNVGKVENTNTFISKDEKIILKTHGISSEKLIEVYLPLGSLSAPWADISTVDIEFNKPADIERVEYIEGERVSRDISTKIESFKLNNIKMSVDAKTNGYVVVKQAYYPGWNVYVNGKKENIQVINGVFMGAQVSQGHNEIEFKFSPIDFKIGAFVSVIYFIFMFYIQKNVKIKLLKKQ